ncbi:hypothetical protein PFLUV_G00028190 [Perca fluviatilis]|uniref:Uncharacterized protein n=1 Tax=Perca fluviatilis TaxID=8168 RepID=A0A6A5FLC6_PERFL|nr:hypothetical protein PFLUV_G00028190 [Perca fluviatilis]
MWSVLNNALFQTDNSGSGWSSLLNTCLFQSQKILFIIWIEAANIQLDGGLGQESVESAEGEQVESILRLPDGDKAKRQTLTKIKTAMEANWSNYNITTHGIGPEMLKGPFALIDACLAEAENLHCFQE